nr:hypothetical protein [Tanacetum cinerariifolium]
MSITKEQQQRIISITKEKQQTLDDALVPREQRLRIGNCNFRLNTTFKPKEPTFQVALDVLSLRPCCQAFLISASIPAIYMHEFRATVSFHKHYIKFKLNKKSYSFDLETFRDMLQIYPKVPGHKFVDPLFQEEILAFIRELGYPDAYKTYYDFATRKVISKSKYVRRSPRKKTDQALKASPGKRLKAIAKKYSDDEDDDDQDDDNADNEDDDGRDDDNEHTKSNNDGDDFVYPKLSTFDEEERHEEKLDEEEVGSDQRFHTPSHFESTADEAYDEVTQRNNVEEEKLDEEKTNEEEAINELYNDVNINLEGRDTKMTDALLANVQATQVIEDTHMLNPNPDTGIDSILNLNTESTSLVDVPVTTNDEIPLSSVTTLPLPPIPLIHHVQQTHVSTPTIAPNVPVTTNDEIPLSSITTLPLPPIPLIHHFEDRVKALEDDFSEFKQTKLFAEAVSSSHADKLQSDRLRDEAKAKNKEFINKIDENIKKIIKEQVKVQVKEQVSKILSRIEKFVNEQLKAEVLTRSSNEAKTSHVVAANLSKLELKKNLIHKMKSNKSIRRSVQQKTMYKALIDAYETDKVILETYRDTVTFKKRRDDEDEDEEPFAGSNRGSKRRRSGKEPESASAPKEKTSKSTGSSKEGSKSKTMSTKKSAQAKEEVHIDKDLEEPTHQEFKTGFTKDHNVDEISQHPDWFKKPVKPSTPDHDWNKTLPIVHGPIQPWISTLAQKEDPRESFNELMDTPLNFSAFVLNRLNVDTLTPELLAGLTFKLMKGSFKREYAHDVYFRNIIIAIKKLTFVEWHNYKHLEWITVRRDDEKLYTFKEGDYNGLRLQDIEDIMLLLVQGKLINLNIEEHLALGVSLRMFTRSIVIKRSVEDLQFGVESYQKKLNLTKPDYSDLDDTLKKIRMKYLPQTILRKVDMERAGAMIQAIN